MNIFWKEKSCAASATNLERDTHGSGTLYTILLHTVTSLKGDVLACN